jgi:WD40 repeat protein
VLLLQGHRDSVRCVAFSPTAPLLATGGDDLTVRLWDAGTRTEVGHVWLATGPRSLAFSADGHLLAVAGMSAGVKVLAVPTGGVLVALSTGQPVHPMSVAFSHSGGLLAYTADGVVRLWDVALEPQRAEPLPAPPAGSYLAFAADGSLIQALPDGSVHVWRYDSVVQHATHELRGRITAIAASRQSSLLAAAFADGQVRLWQPNTPSPEPLPGGHQGEVTALAFAPDGRTLASAGRDGLCASGTWNRGASGLPRLEPRAVFSIAFSPDGQTAVAAGRSPDVVLWDVG